MRHCSSALLVALFAGSALAQTPVPAVHITVTVINSANGIITGLKQEYFRVYEDGKEQQLDDFTQDAPKSIGILVQTSASMTSKVDALRQAAARFVENSGTEDEFFLLGFSDSPQLIAGFTNSPREIEAGLATITPAHPTALWDAVYFGLEKMKEARRQRKVLLVISNGTDTKSHHSYKDVSELARRSDVEIYSIGILDPYAASPEERTGPTFLNELCEETGGFMFRVAANSTYGRSVADLTHDMSDIAQAISIELRHQYIIGFTPHDLHRDGKWRKVKVKLNPPQGLPPLTVHARTGYYAPLQ